MCFHAKLICGQATLSPQKRVQRHSSILFRFGPGVVQCHHDVEKRVAFVSCDNDSSTCSAVFTGVLPCCKSLCECSCVCLRGQCTGRHGGPPHGLSSSSPLVLVCPQEATLSWMMRFVPVAHENQGMVYDALRVRCAFRSPL